MLNIKYCNILMEENILEIIKSKNINKKYTAIIINNNTGNKREISFGARGYKQYKDSTKLKLYSKSNHFNNKRRENYYLRFSKTKFKQSAIFKEVTKSGGKYTAKILSHKYLW